MSKTVNLSIRMDQNLKNEADQMFNELGMSLTTAITVFVRQAVQEQAIPFRISINRDRMISLKAKNAIREAQQQAEVDGTASMTMEDIDAEIKAYRQEKRAK